MRTKEEYYDLVLQNRALAEQPEVVQCTCVNTLCEWHGKCRECVALHRYHGEHLPSCLQPLLKDKLKKLVEVVEMTAVAKEATPLEYRFYVRARDEDEKLKK